MPCSRSWAFLGPVLCACLSPDLAAAESFIIVNGQTTFTRQDLDAVGDTGIVEEGGVIDAPNSGIYSTAEDVTILNAGEVIGTGQGDFQGIVGTFTTADKNTIFNSGSSKAHATGNFVLATGILASDASIVNNSGLALGFSEGNNNSGLGISVGYDNILMNSGSTLASTIGNNSSAIGIEAMDGNTVQNSGSVSAISNGELSRAVGIRASSRNIIENSGTISADATGDYSRAGGMEVQDAPIPGDPGNIISNSGTIRAHADGLEARAFGFQGYIGNSINNSGFIDVEASGINSSATGISGWFDDVLPGDRFENSGRMRVASSGSNSRSIAFGLLIRTPLLNSGFVESSATGDAAEAIGVDVLVGASDINNSGTIRSTASGDDVKSYGIKYGFVGGNNLTNTGTISASASGTGAESYGIWSLGNDTITNCGTISGGTAAVAFDGSNNTLNLCKGSHIEGALLLGEGNALNVDLGKGVNAALRYEGSPTVSTSGRPHVVADNTIAIVDPTGFAAEDDMLNDLTRVIADSVDSRLAAARAGRGIGAVALNGTRVVPTSDVPPGASQDITFWAAAIGQTRDQSGSDDYVGFDSRLGGAVLGLDALVSPGLRAGAFLGASASSLKTDGNSQTIDANSYFGGLYASLQKGAPFLNVALTAGASDQDSNRLLNDNLASGGTSHAKADYSGGFISPQATLGADIAMPGAVFTPSVRARYAALFLNGYDEHGSTADLSVDGRTVQVFDLRGQLAFSVPVAFTAGELSLTTRLGGDATFASDSTVNTKLLGENLNIDINGEDTVDGFAGFDAAFTTLGGTRFFATTEFGIIKGASSTAQASAGFELPL